MVIGQFDVKVILFVVVNMMVIIVCGGEKKQVKVVDVLEYKNNMLLYMFKEYKLKGDSINKVIVVFMQQFLKGVVQSEKGIGRRF